MSKKVILYGASRCPGCQQMKGIVEKMKDDSFEYQYIDVDKLDTEEMKTLPFRLLPYILIYNGTGNSPVAYNRVVSEEVIRKILTTESKSEGASDRQLLNG